ncbi:MAG: ADP-glyceromanno-heptose 6-epimerase [Bacteroidales bacterium]|nr:ADP-glyceromanno-heptose 6-epimerase [Bacteroidales bacterium]
MIIVTGATGFIGSVLVGRLNQLGLNQLVIVDDFSREDKMANLHEKECILRIHRDLFGDWLEVHYKEVEFIFHIGARTDTAEFDPSVFDKLNLNYSKMVWQKCTEHQIPLIYASSAATYGLGEHGYEDRHDIVPQLKPLNPYGESKNNFDKWVLSQDKTPPFWAGFKFFNVYGPNEYHKSRMASVVFHAFHQISKTVKMKLFRSHHPDFEDGKQLRDFVFVKDVVDVLTYFMENRHQSGLYNLGTGQARSFLDLAKAVFYALGREPVIEFIDTPEDIRDKYQYFTEAHMQKVRSYGYTKPFHTLEEGVSDYVTNFLVDGKYL